MVNRHLVNRHHQVDLGIRSRHPRPESEVGVERVIEVSHVLAEEPHAARGNFAAYLPQPTEGRRLQPDTTGP